MRNPVFRVYILVRHKSSCMATVDGYRLESIGFRKERDCTINVAKTKALISCTFTVQLIAPLFHICKKQVISGSGSYNKQPFLQPWEPR